MHLLLNYLPRFFIVLIFFLALQAGFFLPIIPTVYGQSASLFLSPSSGTYTVGNTFDIAVRVNTGGVAINAAQGSLVFDPDKLAVVSVGKESTIFSLWTQDPIFSNSLGTISFGGGIPNPGFSGSAGTIMVIKFRARTADGATVSFSSGSVLANDGRGTNILSSLGGGSYVLRATTSVPPPATPTPTPDDTSQEQTASGRIGAPVVTSSTHPDERKWFSNNSPKLQWELLAGVTAISYAIDKNSRTNPGFITTNIVNEETFPDLTDGIWYLHINFRTASGWGPLTHRQVLIDTTSPSPFDIVTDDRSDTTHPQPLLHFSSADATSGIERYEVKIGTGEIFSAPSNTLEMPLQAPGRHDVTVWAVDKAGNKRAAFASVFIEPLPNPPVITDYPARLSPDETLTVRGKSSYPNTDVLLTMRGENNFFNEAKIPTNENGNWQYTHDERLGDGLYTIFAVAKDERGALSLPSTEVTTAVEPPALIKFGNLAIDFLTTIITLVVLLGALIVGTWYGWFRFHNWQRRLHKETLDAERALHSAFDALHEEFSAQFKELEKAKHSRKLTKEEENLHSALNKNLKIAEKFVSKELKDIEKEVG